MIPTELCAYFPWAVENLNLNGLIFRAAFKSTKPSNQVVRVNINCRAMKFNLRRFKWVNEPILVN